jgi:hypothetical protein
VEMPKRVEEGEEEKTVAREDGVSIQRCRNKRRLRGRRGCVEEGAAGVRCRREKGEISSQRLRRGP